MKKILAIIPLLLIALNMPLQAAPEKSPTETVKESVQQVLKILKDDSLSRNERWQRIGKIIDDRFDFRSMSQSVLATNWKRATPEERERFVEYFSQYIEETYREKIEKYDDQEVRFLDEKIYGKRALVKMVIITEKNEIPVDFRVKNNDDEWYSYDVVIEGVSLVNNYRNTFSTIVKNDGMDGLLADIKRRVEKHKANQAASGEQQ